MAKEIKITCKAADGMALDELYEFQGELKTISDDELEKLKKSIVKYGFSFPIFVWKSKVLDGHQRLKAVKQLIEQGYKIKDNNLPVVRIEAKNEKEAAEKLLLINSRYAKIDQEGFQVFTSEFDLDLDEMAELIELPEIDFSFDDGEDYQGLTDPDEVPEVEETPVSKTGDIWLLGDHRLMCGDSTNEDDVKKLINGKKCRMMITSPPYENQREYSTWESYDEYNIFIDKIIKNSKKIKLDDFVAFWNIGSSEPTNTFIPADHYKIFLDNNFEWIEWIIWNKESATWTIPRSMHIEKNLYIPALQWESLIVFKMGKRPHFDPSDKKEIRTWQENVWEINKVIGSQQKKIGHPAIYPVEIPYRSIKSYSKKGEYIYEPFSGSGTTIIAAEQTGRRCYAMEISPQYVDVAVKRWQDFIGKDAVLESNSKNFNTVSSSLGLVT
jgi:DNA modification methylase